MARNVLYRWQTVNERGWTVTVETTPSNDFTDEVTNSMASADVVIVPAEVILWDEAPPIIKHGFSSDTNLFVGTTETAAISLGWDIGALEKATQKGYANAADLEDLATYLLSPTTETGVRIDIESDGSTYTDLSTGNFFRITLSDGPFTEPVIVFEGVQEEMGIDDLVMLDAKDGTDGGMHLTINIRHWWRVALERIPTSTFCQRVLAATTPTTERFQYDQLYSDGTTPFGHYSDIGYSIYRIPGGGLTSQYEHAEMYVWHQLWIEFESAVQQWYRGHTRIVTSSVEIASEEAVPTQGAAPTDNVTLYQRDNTEDNDRGTAIVRTGWRYTGRFVLKRKDTGAETLETGGFLSSRATWGLQRQKTLWDFLVMLTEQSIMKCLLIGGTDSTSSTARIRFTKIYDSEFPSTGGYSENALKLFHEDMILPDAGLVVHLRENAIGEAESGMNEGSGVDVQKIDFKGYGHEQRDGFNLPIMIHNLPKVGVAERDKGNDTHSSGLGSFNQEFQADYVVGLQRAAGYEGCLWYLETTSNISTILDSAEAGTNTIIRVHSGIDIDLGNGTIIQDTTSVSLPTETDEKAYPPLIAAANLEEQTTTGWPYFAAQTITEQFSIPKQFPLAFQVPGEKGLPNYVGSWFGLYDNDGVLKGLQVWRNSSRLDSLPKVACLLSTELNLQTGMADVKLHAHTGGE